MSGPSKVFVLEPDARAGRQLQLGFAREGVPAEIVEIPADPAALAPLADAALVLVGGDGGAALELVRRTRALLARTGGDVPGGDVPIVFTGRAVPRADAEAAGADEVIARPAYLRDVVTVGRLLRGVPASQRDHLVGSLVETTGVYTLVRALAALGRSAVLTLIRGLRRGEVRFFHGEVTSAQVGLIHGQAALHQLLLWTDARFDFQHEDIVRRHQIPLPASELFADAERFLEGVRESAGALSPAMVLEMDAQRIQGLGKLVPTEVHGVLRMFDGHRVLADVLEDSPYRVFETLRVAGKALEAGLLRVVEAQRPKATWRAVLALEEWLVGNETREAVVARTAQLDSGPVARPKPSGSRKRRKKRRAATPPAGTKPVKPEIDWGALVPRVIGAEVGPLSGVVPTMQTAGEIEAVATRDRPREGLEALMDTAKRDRIFPTEVGIEPSVVLDEREAATPADDTEAAAPADDAEAAAPADDAEAAAPAGDAEAQRARDEAQAQVHANVERLRIEREAREEAEARAREEARRKAAIDEAVDYAARAKAAADVRRAEAEARRAQAEAADHAAASMIAVPTAPPKAADPAAALAAAPKEASAPSERPRTSTDATVLVQRLVADAVAPAATAAPPAPEGTEAPASAAAPVATEDEPSDGIVRAAIATIDTEKLARVRPPSAPLTDGPPVTEVSGEIGAPGRIQREPERGPSILVADLGAAHQAAMAAASRPAEPPPGDAASPARELAVHEVRKDAAAFTEAEEAFFRGADSTPPVVPSSTESFADLDEGYEPPKFWDRVFGRKRKRASSPAVPVVRRPPTED